MRIIASRRSRDGLAAGPDRAAAQQAQPGQNAFSEINHDVQMIHSFSCSL